ncbi:hypothetical protein CJF30_00009651 [Rutstroemia sp. NJR-2017a BBW]|nr:hypothetical protein CJF30_00009651 [Rutstroemia sp. NJR-2017a BBW]
MLFTTVSLLALPLLSLASPITSRQAVCSSSTTIVKMDYYQGYMSPSNCGVDVSSGNITANVCTNMVTQGVNVFPSDSKNCVFTLWRGVTDCSGTPASTYDLTVGGSAQCVGTGVMEPRWYHGSGKLTCEC